MNELFKFFLVIVTYVCVIAAVVLYFKYLRENISRCSQDCDQGRRCRCEPK